MFLWDKPTAMRIVVFLVFFLLGEVAGDHGHDSSENLNDRLMFRSHTIGCCGSRDIFG